MQSADQTPKNTNPLSEKPADWPKPMQEAVQILRDAFIGVYQQQARTGSGQAVKETEEQ